jgi:hypothetical protein
MSSVIYPLPESDCLCLYSKAWMYKKYFKASLKLFKRGEYEMHIMHNNPSVVRAVQYKFIDFWIYINPDGLRY